MALKILLVDTDDAWLYEAKKYFLAQMYEVSTATNGKDAQLSMYNNKFFAVVINLEIQNHSCAQVLKFIKSNHTNQKIIIVVNDKKLLEAEETTEEKLIKQGALEIAVRPFEPADLKDIIEGHQSLNDLVASITKNKDQSEESEVVLSDKKFTKIRIDEFYSSQAILFNIYIKLGTGKYLKILNQGDSFSNDRIDKYKNEKNVEHLYFLNSDRRKFVQYNNFLALKLLENNTVPTLKKFTTLKNVSEKFIEEAYTTGVKPQVVDQGKEVCETVFQLLSKQNDLFSVLKTYQDLDPNAFSHAFLVTLYATSIIKQFEWQSKSTIETAALACMFHDIGKTMLPEEFLELKTSAMTAEQLEQYKLHPELGLKLLEGNKMINNSVKQVIYQHHEAYNGTGFPSGLSGKNILTLANIVCLADDFVHLMIDQKLNPTDCLKKMISDKEMLKRYNSIIIEKFIKVFVDPAKLQRANILPVNSRIVKSSGKIT
jgi:putative nucleotidyltransferase with HDIG domain